MTGPDRVTSVLKAYTESSRVSYNARGTAGPIEDTVQISSEGLQKSKEYWSTMEDTTSSKKDASSSQQTNDSLEIFNLSSSASMDQIHRAYISAIKQYHPDNFNGYSPEFKKWPRKRANKSFSAYKKLTKLPINPPEPNQRATFP